MFIGGGYFSAGYQSMGSDPYGNYKQGQDTGQLTVTLTKQLGTQELKFGFDGRLHQMNYIQTNAPNGTFSFGQGGTAQCPNDVATCGGDAMATFLMGYPGSGRLLRNPGPDCVTKTISLPDTSRTTGEQPTN